VFGYKGKQVRDNIHSLDVARFIHAFFENPRRGEVYNIGGGRENSTSILEAFEGVSRLSGKPMRWTYSEQHRVADHLCYISDLAKMKAHYPGWSISKSLEQIYVELLEGIRSRDTSGRPFPNAAPA
jgi:CDP-paratose 2-epimerase